jgi:biopolymer transport protein ExbB/TolQ
MATNDKQRKLTPATRDDSDENRSGAGAGALGFFGFLALTALALMFFIAESFFLAMLLMSFALLFYVAGAEMLELMKAAFTVFFSQKHLDPKAVYVQQTVAALRHHLKMKKDSDGVVRAGIVEKGLKIKLPDNPLVRDMQAVLKREKGSEYASYVGHQYYVDCRELYDHFHAHLEFVAGVMPLLGLIGTVVGLIGMFDKLGPNTSVETLAPELAISLQTTLYGAVLASAFTVLASRFDQRIKALEYDYDVFAHAIDVLVKNEVVIEVEA